MEFKDFLSSSPKIQGLFKTVETLWDTNMAAVSLCWDTKTTWRHVKTLYKTKTDDSLWKDQ